MKNLNVVDFKTYNDLKKNVTHLDYEADWNPKICMALVIDIESDTEIKYSITFNHTDFLFYDDVEFIEVLWTDFWEEKPIDEFSLGPDIKFLVDYYMVGYLHL